MSALSSIFCTFVRILPIDLKLYQNIDVINSTKNHGKNCQYYVYIYKNYENLKIFWKTWKFPPLLALSRKRIRSLSNSTKIWNTSYLTKVTERNWQYLWSFSHNFHLKSQKLPKFKYLRKIQRCCWKITLWKKNSCL